ncbi:hypothetical protein CBL_07378 [Carabus blaptoides fortunei]
MKASSSSSVTVDQKKTKTKPVENRLNMRRGSSMSELDKLTTGGGLPDLVRSTTANNRLSTSQTSKGYDSLPHSPHLSRSGVNKTGSCSVRGSIGDLMNQKKYGSSSWSIRSETLIARTVPLSTVTPTRHSPPTPCFQEDLMYRECISILDCSAEHVDLPSPGHGYPLTCAQRTQRLSKLIKQQRNTLEYASTITVSSWRLKNENR